MPRFAFIAAAFFALIAGACGSGSTPAPSPTPSTTGTAAATATAPAPTATPASPAPTATVPAATPTATATAARTPTPPAATATPSTPAAPIRRRRASADKRPGAVVHLVQPPPAHPAPGEQRARAWDLLSAELARLDPVLADIEHARAFRFIDDRHRADWERLSRKAEALGLALRALPAFRLPRKLQR